MSYRIQLINDEHNFDDFSQIPPGKACRFVAVKLVDGSFFCTCEAEYAATCMRNSPDEGWCPFKDKMPWDGRHDQKLR